MNDRIRIDVDDHKYTIVQPEDGQVYVLRYGKPWLDADTMTGANMILAMAYELEELRYRIRSLEH